MRVGPVMAIERSALVAANTPGAEDRPSAMTTLATIPTRSRRRVMAAPPGIRPRRDAELRRAAWSHDRGLRGAVLQEPTGPKASFGTPASTHRAGGTTRARLRGCGAPGRIRTADAGLRTAALYPLSYGGATRIVARSRAATIGPGP